MYCIVYCITLYHPLHISHESFPEYHLIHRKSDHGLTMSASVFTVGNFIIPSRTTMWKSNVKVKTVLLVIIVRIGFLTVPSMAQKESVTFPIHSIHPKPIVKVTLNGKAAYFLLDTGSDINIVNSSDAGKYDFAVYKINYGNRGSIATVNGTERDFGHAYNIHIMIGGRHIPCGVVSMDISSIVKSVRKKTGISIAGIIGSDTMKSYHFIIDYENEVIAIKLGK